MGMHVKLHTSVPLSGVSEAIAIFTNTYHLLEFSESVTMEMGGKASSLHCMSALKVKPIHIYFAETSL